MAIFELWIAPDKRRGRRIRAGYQNLYLDKGNWTSGQIGVGVQAGTMGSISAFWLTGHLGRQVTVREMQALTFAQLKNYYKVGFWDKIQADQINSQIIAEFVADMKSSGGGNGVKEFQKALASVGQNVAIDGAWGTQTLTATNAAIAQGKEKALYNTFRNNMIAYYERIGVGTNAAFKKGWITSLNEDYPPIDEQIGVGTGGVVLVLLGVSWYLLRRGKIGAITKFHTKGSQPCATNNYSTANGRGACSYHGGTLKSKFGQWKTGKFEIKYKGLDGKTYQAKAGNVAGRAYIAIYNKNKLVSKTFASPNQLKNFYLDIKKQ